MTELERDELALADYDHLPVPALRDRVRALTADEVRQLLDYERAHADRAPVVTVLEARLDQLDHGAQPSPGEHDIRPEQGPPARGASPVSPASSPEPIHPPPHGYPGTPAKPKADRASG